MYRQEKMYGRRRKADGWSNGRVVVVVDVVVTFEIITSCSGRIYYLGGPSLARSLA